MIAASSSGSRAADSPDLAFVVTDPALWVPGYSVPLRAEQAQEIGLVNPADAQHFVIVNRRDRSLTANLQGPLVINAAARRGLQVVLADRRWSTRHELVQMEAATRGMAASADSHPGLGRPAQRKDSDACSCSHGTSMNPS